MHELCHRCHGELPASLPGASPNGTDATLFCPRCGAPQICLPEHMQTEVEGPPGVNASTTGAMPPPLAGPSQAGAAQVDWRAALAAAAWVALGSALLMLASLKVSWLLLPSLVWTAGGAVIALGFYARWRPAARMDARIGIRIGATTGLLMITAMACTLAITGVVLRFGTHRMAGFDGDTGRQYEVLEAQMKASLQQQNQPAEVQARVLNFTHSPEARTGLVLVGLGLQGGMIFLLAVGGGGFAGLMRTARKARPELSEGD